MGQTAVTINGRTYQVACGDGQEQHLAELATDLDKRVGELTAALGQVGDARLLVMASLLIADELADTRAALEAERSRTASLPPEAETAVAARVEALAQRIENIAAHLEAA